MRRLKNAKDPRFTKMREDLLDIAERHFDRPASLAMDYVLARVFKLCCIILDFEHLLGNKEIENEYYHFKDQFDSRIRREETRDHVKDVIKEIFLARDEISKCEQVPDFFE